ncbi:hypothetical protein PENSTE_c004G04240 [Penicillium steckii]|uniref:Uncharacterized protein n=1 Tax=Penicillium steckii TaxID=303698 RepID=A0A1V6TMZ4_9EURO|nr:hypothetical protein PENSTE_c004G04240 [Penicillium steckii]
MDTPHPLPPRTSPEAPVAFSPWHERYPPNSSSSRASFQTAPPVVGDTTTSTPNNHSPSIDRNEAIKRKTVLPLLLFDDGDTLVFIDPPPNNKSYSVNKSSTAIHRIHSEKLLSTGSTYLTELFKLRVQTRVAKQRGFQNGLPNGIKYLLDLTPAILDEDAIISLTEVSCPPGIRTWASLQSMWNLPLSCVGGDDICELVTEETGQNVEPSLQPSTPRLEPDIDGIFDLTDAEFENLAATDAMLESKPATLPVEYSPDRHREGIEHVLHALEGLSVTLDTPCKLWTFFAIAKVFDVATIPAISGYILSWFFESENTKFIEIHPEIAYRVACGIRSSELCRHAYLGIVGDEALLHLIRSGNITPLRSNYKEKIDRSRITGFLEDVEVQRIEYASKSFADDTVNFFLLLAGDDMSWFQQSPELKKLLQLKQDLEYPEDQRKVDAFIDLLKEFVRYRIYDFLRRSRDPIRSCDVVPQSRIYNSSVKFHLGDVLHRLIGKGFWYDLLGINIISDSDFGPRRFPHQTISDIGVGLLPFKSHGRARIVYHSRGTVEEKANVLNQKFRMNEKKLSDARNGQLNLTINLRQRYPLPESENTCSSSTSTSTTGPILKPQTLVTRNRRPLEYVDGNQPDSNSEPATVSHPEDDLAFPFGPPSLDEAGPMATEGDYDEAQSWNSDTKWTPIQPQPATFATDRGPSNDPSQFDLTDFLVWANTHIRQSARQLVFPPGRSFIQFESIDTLICLSDNQMKLLPLWAGGNDDGSGGVFADQDIPIMETGGFSAPGPSVSTGSTAPTEDSFSEICPSDSQSTVQRASHHATYSHCSYLQSVTSVDSDSMVDNSDSMPMEMEPIMENLESEPIMPTIDEIDFNMDGADSDSNSTLMGNQSDFSDDIDFEKPHDCNDNNDDDEHDEHDNNDGVLVDTNLGGFELVDEST